MLVVNGKYNDAIIYSDRYDENAYAQLVGLCNLKSFEGAKIRVMPDYHAGAGCVIGFTSFGAEKLIPNIIGVDIGCGVYAVEVSNHFNLEKLDNYIRNYVPSGFQVQEKVNPVVSKMLKDLTCYEHLVNTEHLEKSIGTLGGGNHFIEVDVDKNGKQWLVVHTGSRNIGKQVALYHQKLAEKFQGGIKESIQEKIKDVEPKDREKWIKEFRASHKIPKGLEHLEGRLLENYVHDMILCQTFAKINRWNISINILRALEMGGKDCSYIESVHNYYDSNIIRKGAISAQKGEYCIIPMNMRDGSLICKGKGNPEWNFSAPHGAGRLMSRSQAKENISLEDFQKSMKGIYTTSVNTSTIDESPMAYKPMEEIIEQVKDTVDIVDIIKPVYNFKASE